MKQAAAIQRLGNTNFSMLAEKIDMIRKLSFDFICRTDYYLICKVHADGLIKILHYFRSISSRHPPYP